MIQVGFQLKYFLSLFEHLCFPGFSFKWRILLVSKYFYLKHIRHRNKWLLFNVWTRHLRALQSFRMILKNLIFIRVRAKLFRLLILRVFIYLDYEACFRIRFNNLGSILVVNLQIDKLMRSICKISCTSFDYKRKKLNLIALVSFNNICGMKIYWT